MLETAELLPMFPEAAFPPPLLDIPIARLQVIRSGEQITEEWPGRPAVEPDLYQNQDGLWLLSLKRQGEHGKFAIPYIGSEVVYADAELGLVVVLVGYHGIETHGPKKNRHTNKGQFYRYYQQTVSGDWARVLWRHLSDAWRQLILEAIAEHAPSWARSPGKLSSERKPPAPVVAMTSYKVVRFIEGRYYSLYDPKQEYILGERVKQRAKPGHNGGFFSYPTLESGLHYLECCVRCIPFHSEIATPQLAFLECEIGGHMIDYKYKVASTYLRPVRVLEIRDIHEEDDCSD
jgi:hypothetical protein